MSLRKLFSWQKSVSNSRVNQQLLLETLENRVMLSTVSDTGLDTVDTTPDSNLQAANISYVFQEAPVAQASAASFPVTVSNGVATVDLTDGAMINDAFVFLTDYVDANASVQSGVVNIVSDTTFSESLRARDNVVLNIEDSVTLTLDTLLDPLADGPAIRLSNTSFSGVTGGGTLNINGNARQGIYGIGLDNVQIGNVNSTDSTPIKLKVVGWQAGVFLGSSSNVAATDITISNLELSQPDASHVEFPLTITNRPSANGQWVDGLTVTNVLVDGGQPDGNGGTIGGAHGLNNGFTADQIALQGVHNAVLNDVTSLNGGENGFTVSFGSRNVVLNDFVIDSPDAHAFNVGGGSQAIDVVSETGFATGQQVRGVTSGTTAEVFRTFDGRVWVSKTGGNRFEIGETLEVVDAGVSVSTEITGTNRTANITINNATTTNAGLNVTGGVDANGQLVAFSDVFIQQADDVSINDSQFHSIGRTDPAGGLALHYGINAGVSNFALSGNTFNDYGNNQIPISLNANSFQDAGTPDTNAINGTSNDDIIQGTDFADVIQSEEGADRILSGSGNDTVEGGAGDDDLFGNDGDDQLTGGLGDDYLSGGDGEDLLSGGDGEDRIFGEDGIDTLIGGENDDYLAGGDGDDNLNGGGGEDTLIGGIGNDTIAGGDDDDFIRGLSGDDIIQGDAGDDQLQGESGDDTILGGTGDDRILGGSGVDQLDGGDGLDNLFGEAGNDTLIGDAGVDRLEGGDDDDVLYGGTENDILRGDAGHDILYGGADNDSLDGGDGDDQLNGDAGDDNLRGGAGADAFDGGEGLDVVDYRNATSGVTADLQDSQRNAGVDATGDTYTNVEDIYGTDFDDTLSGDAQSNTISGDTGSDIINGRGGDDVINAGLGDDVLIGGAGADALNGSGGFDTASYFDATDGVVVDLASNENNTGDALGDTYSGIQRIVGTDHADVIGGNGAVNELEGGADDDTILGRGGDDILRGGDGDDLLQGDQGGDTLIGGEGNDTAGYQESTSAVLVFLDDAASNGGIASGDTFDSIENISGSDFNDTLAGDASANLLNGGLGNDKLVGNDGDDVLSGGDGDDEFEGGNGADSFIGGSGTDIVSYRNSSAGLIIDFLAPGDSTGEALGDSFVEVEDIYGTDFGDEISGDGFANEIRGYAGQDTLFGRGGDDILTGGDSDDVLVGGAGADEIRGGDGVDVASYIDATEGITLDLDATASNTGDASGDTFIGVEAFRGSEFTDTIGGSGAANDLDGGGGDDFLDGRGGNDTLRGGAGNDVLEGGRGADAIFGGEGIDTATFVAATSAVRVYLTDPGSNAGIAAGDTFDSVENLIGGGSNDTLSGDAHANEIRGEVGDDKIFGEAGDDVLLGGVGDDQLTGGDGNDVMTGGEGTDRFIFDAGWGNDTIIDFADGSEKLDLRGIAGIDELSDLTITDVSGGVQIAFRGNTIKLDGLQASDISRTDFFLDAASGNSNPTTTSVGESGVVSENGLLTDSGTIAFEDMDAADTHSALTTLVSTTHTSQLGTLTAAVTSSTPDGEVTWNYAVDNSAIEFLNSGESVTEVFNVTIHDDQGNGVDVEVTITINGDSTNQYVINTTGDKPDVDLNDGVAIDEDGNTSLRAAIMQANAASPGEVNQLTFALPGNNLSEHVIQLDSALPVLNSTIELDGENSTGGVVVLDGSSLTGGVFDGLRIEADNVQISGLILVNFSSDGIEVRGADNVIISEVFSADNGGAGVRFNNATNSIVSQSTAVGNGTSGVQLVGSTASQGNLIDGNRLGIGFGDVADGNRNYGIQVRSDGNVISNNTISGNQRTGLIFSGVAAQNNLVTGNLIGTDSAGNVSVANGGFGVLVTGADNNTFTSNVISGNAGSGFTLSNGSTGNQVDDNIVGLNANANTAIGNGSVGLFLRGGVTENSFNGNFVAGNGTSQISLVAGTTTANSFTGNFVGFGDDFTPIAGGSVGVLIKSPGNFFGGALASDANFVSGSTSGISLSGLSARDNVIQNNVIGTNTANPTGTGFSTVFGITNDEDFGMTNGIQFLQQSRNNLVVENVIAYSSGDGLRSPSGGNGNTFSRNTLLENNLGIDLGANGLTANDAADADNGPNGLQNTPVIIGDILVESVPNSGVELTITYSLDSLSPNSAYPVTVEFFFSDDTGNDAFYFGSDVFSAADSISGTPKTITLTDVTLPSLFSLTKGVATATDDSGNTSELSAASFLRFLV